MFDTSSTPKADTSVDAADGMTASIPVVPKRSKVPALMIAGGVTAVLAMIGVVVGIVMRGGDRVSTGIDPHREAAEIQYSAAREAMLELLSATDTTSGTTAIVDGVKTLRRYPEFMGLEQRLRMALAAEMVANAAKETGDPDHPAYRQSPIVPLDARIEDALQLASVAMMGEPVTPVRLIYTDPNTGEDATIWLTPDEMAAALINRAAAASDAIAFQYAAKPQGTPAAFSQFVQAMRAVRQAHQALLTARGEGETALDIEHRYDAEGVTP